MIRAKVQTELERLEKCDIIEKVTGPTDWVSSMVTVIKGEKVLICIDPKDLNQAIKREHFPIKTVEEVMARMPKAAVFSKLDAHQGFYQVELDDESSDLCTFNTPYGRYKYKRMPFGISSAPEVFQAIMSQIFDDIEGVEVIADDILVWGEDTPTHDRRLKEVLERARERM